MPWLVLRLPASVALTALDPERVASRLSDFLGWCDSQHAPALENGSGAHPDRFSASRCAQDSAQTTI